MLCEALALFYSREREMKTPTEILWLTSQEQLCNTADSPNTGLCIFPAFSLPFPSTAYSSQFELCYLYYVLSHFLAFLSHLFSYSLYLSAAKDFHPNLLLLVGA